MDEPDKKMGATLLQPREGAGKYWWETFLRSHISDINRRFNQAKALYIAPDTNAPIDLFSYIREAALCFEIGRYLPAITLASRGAVMVLERDRRTRTNPAMVRCDGERITLCSHNFITARELGLPTETLLSANEDIHQDETITFVERSDRVNRGDVSVWFHAISDYMPTVEHDALDQLEKAQRFVVTWFNSLTDALGSDR
jgi:hypothetical protein